MGGAGQLSIPFITMGSPPSTPLLLRSLGSALLPLGLFSLEPVVSLLTSPEEAEGGIGAFQVGMFHIMPVKDFQINAADDPKDASYEPRDSPFDRRNWDVCELACP